MDILPRLQLSDERAKALYTGSDYSRDDMQSLLMDHVALKAYADGWRVAANEENTEAFVYHDSHEEGIRRFLYQEDLTSRRFSNAECGWNWIRLYILYGIRDNSQLLSTEEEKAQRSCPSNSTG